MTALAVLLAAQAAVAEPVALPVLRAHLHDWDGRRVEVHGWAHGCAERLAYPCFLTPRPEWHRGRDRLLLVAGPGYLDRPGDMTAVEVVVQGIVDEFRCAPEDICLDGADSLRVDALHIVGTKR